LKSHCTQVHDVQGVAERPDRWHTGNPVDHPRLLFVGSPTSLDSSLQRDKIWYVV
jgi:hypothetical protein